MSDGVWIGDAMRLTPEPGAVASTARGTRLTGDEPGERAIVLEGDVGLVPLGGNERARPAPRSSFRAGVAGAKPLR